MINGKQICEIKSLTSDALNIFAQLFFYQTCVSCCLIFNDTMNMSSLVLCGSNRKIHNTL